MPQAMPSRHPSTTLPSTCACPIGTKHIAAKSLLIVEGILALHFARLRPYFDLSIYLDAPEEVCFHRRKVRDITERQRSLDFILWQYKNAVLPATRQYVLPSKNYAGLVVDSEGDLATVEKNVYDAIVEKRTLAAVQQTCVVQKVR